MGTTSAKNLRLSLDGLRGVASLVVVFHHAALTIPALSDAYFDGTPVSGRLNLLLAYSPLHLLWAGTEAVMVFFILSGFVLTLPSFHGRRDWGLYYPSRIVRLYIPVAAAVVFTLLTVLLVPRSATPPSLWVFSHKTSYDLTGFVTDLVLVGGISGVASHLWSLQWEVIFSLLLPLYIYLIFKMRARWLFLASVVLVALGTLANVPAVEYLPMFGVGVAMAKAWPGLTARADRLNARQGGWVIWAIVVVICLFLIVSSWLHGPPPTGTWFPAVTRIPILIGAAGLVITAGLSPMARSFFDWAPIGLLGRISFSLYLVHEPIVMVFAELAPHHPRVGGIIAVLVSLPIAWLFYRVVEGPSQVLARRIAHSGPVVPITDPDGLVPSGLTEQGPALVRRRDLRD